MDSVAQWLDTSLVTEPTLLSLMESCNSQPFNGFEFTSSGSCVKDEFSMAASHASTNNFELTNGFHNGYAFTEAERKSSLVRSDATSGSFSTQEQPSQVLDELTKVKKEVSNFILGHFRSSHQCLTSRTKRRRAQNRKAQQAFRQRKDSAIARLEREMEKLKSINQELTHTNTARFQEILELKARLGALRLAPLSPSMERHDAEEEKNADLSPSSMVHSLSAEDATTANTVPWIEWRGRLYIENQVLAISGTGNGWSSFVGSSIGPVQGKSEDC
jgi:hypothetical protein